MGGEEDEDQQPASPCGRKPAAERRDKAVLAQLSHIITGGTLGQEGCQILYFTYACTRVCHVVILRRCYNNIILR